jgi:hypothetical protein
MRFKVSIIAIPSRNFRQRWSWISGRRDSRPAPPIIARRAGPGGLSERSQPESLRVPALMRFRSQVAQFNHRTKTEHLATILLPNPVAAHDTSRHAMDGLIKISKENRTLGNRPLQAEMGAAAFRVRCSRPLQFSKRRRGPDRPAPGISSVGVRRSGRRRLSARTGSRHGAAPTQCGCAISNKRNCGCRS